MPSRDELHEHTPRNRHNRVRSRSIDDAWGEKDSEDIGTVEDYSSIIFNLHVWSYRLSQQEFSKYERRAQLQQAAQVFDHRHLSLLFRDGSLSRTLSLPSRHHHQHHQQQQHQHQQQQQQQQQEHDEEDIEAEEGMQLAGYTQSQHDLAEETLRQREMHAPLLPRSATGGSSNIRLVRPRRYMFRWSFSRSGMKIGAVGKNRARSWLGMRMLPVNHPAMVAWSLLMLMIDLTYTAILLPMMFAFDLLQPWEFPYWISVAVGFLFFVDVFVMLHRGVVVRYLDRHIYIDNPADVAYLYVTHGSFWRDLPVALSGPLQLLALVPGDAINASHVAVVVDTFLLLRGLRLIKLLLLSRELFFGKMGFRHMGHTLYRSYSLSLVYVLAVLLNWLSCIMLLVARYEGLESSWLADVNGEDLTSAPASHKYIAAFYWMLISTLTIGYGDISATSAIEQVAVICAVITGVLFIGYAIKSLMDIFVEAALQDEYAQRISTLRVQAGALKVWTRWQDLPPALEEPMFRYFMGPWLTNQVVCKHWGSVLQDLPAQLRGQVLEHLLVVKHKELSPLGVRLLANISRTAGWHVLSLLQPLPLAPGQQLCWKGTEAKYIWLLQEGSLVELDGVVPDLNSITDSPGLVIAFDALTWLQQQRQKQQQQQQHVDGHNSSRHRGDHRRNSSTSGNSSSGGHVHKHCHHQHARTPHAVEQQQQQQQQQPSEQQQQQQQQQQQERTVSDTIWATPLASRTVSAADESFPTAFAHHQQQQRLEQQQQGSQTRGGVFAAIQKEISSSSRHSSRQPSGMLPEQQGQPAAAAPAVQQQQQRHQDATEEPPPATPEPDISSSVTSSPSNSSGATPGPIRESVTPGVTGVTAGPTQLVTYTRSYQAVGTSFFWALPLHQLSLAFEGLPQLLENLHAELAGMDQHAGRD